MIDQVSSHHLQTRHRGSRPGDIRRLNRAAALKLLRDQPRGRAELARTMGLSKTALSDLISDLISAGIVIDASAPPSPVMGASTLSAMSTPMAPAFWAFFTFTVKPQVPRSMIATLPVIAAVSAASNAAQP